MSRDVRRRLEDAGRQPVPDVDPAFADALEARLLAVAVSTPPSPESPRRRGPSWRIRLAAGGATLAVAALVIALAIAGLRPAADDADLVALELVAPVNVEVALADGTTLENPDGLLLPEGTVIVVGNGGSARIGDTVLGPGDVATVEHGDLRVEHRGGAVGSVTSTPVPTATRQPERTTAPTRAPTPRPDGTPKPTTTVATSAPTSAATRPPTPAPTTKPTDAPPIATQAPTPSPTPAIVRPRLRARLIDGPRIAVTWTATYRARSYALIVTGAASGPAPDPVYPGSRVIGTFARPPDLPLRFRVPAGVHEMRIQVIALRRDGSVLRRSNIVTITIPPGDSQGSSTAPDATPTRVPTPTPTPTSGP
jgi:hypothetical protein